MIPGELVNLRAYEPEDLDNLMAWVNDREITKYVARVFPVSRAAEREWLEKASHGQNPAARVFAIETKDGTYLGSVDLRNINYIDGTAELAIAIGRKDYWGKGYGTDAARTLLRFGFNNLRLRKVYLTVADFNARGIASYNKLGFREVGRLKAHRLCEGKYVDKVFMEVFADELT